MALKDWMIAFNSAKTMEANGEEGPELIAEYERVMRVNEDIIRYMNKMVNPYMVGELTREVAATALGHPEFVDRAKTDFAVMKERLREELDCSALTPSGSGRLHMAETLDTNSLLLLYHDDKKINLKEEFWNRGVLVVDGNDFKGLDSSAARIRLPRIDEFPVLLEAVREISKL